MNEYNPKQIEKKWQTYWEQNKSFEPKEDMNLPKKYILSMFPYPSGAIHMGHVRNYCIGDALARNYRKNGFNVLHPMGWDAFGMPAENAAIKRGIHPKTWTYKNIDNMREELQSLGLSFSKEREFATSDALYSKWEQEFFIKMWEKGLIYRKKAYLNWCPNDKTVLANEQVVDGKCWRCDTDVVQKEMNQYYIKITDYADELLKDLDSLEGHWPSQVLTMQRNWIGKSKGLEFSLSFSDDSKNKLKNSGIDKIDVFTTRADTIYGVTYAALSPEHKIVEYLLNNDLLQKDVAQNIKNIQNQNARERAQSQKVGYDLGLKLIHPLTKAEIPLWVANFVLSEYGSGAVMSVPAHDERDYEFATKYNLPILSVVKPSDNTEESLPFCEYGILKNSDTFDTLSSQEAKEQITNKFQELGIGKGVINFKLRDWGVSRQRYWGAPIPMIHCKDCGIVCENIENLPVTLPEDVQIDGSGNPLDKHPTWKNTTCPKCHKDALRESDTMDTFVESSWYFLRYTTPKHLSQNAAFDSKSLKYWLGVDEYIGGIEHAILHLLYARFFTKVLRDLGYINLKEPFSNLITQGMVLKDGAKMSKSKGNVVDPNELINKYGADSARLFILFAAPPTRELEWNDDAVEGSYRFIKRLWDRSSYVTLKEMPKIDALILNKNEKLARKKVYEALHKSNEIFSKNQSGYAFNTLIAASMEALNALNEQDNTLIWSEGYYILLNILEPIIPHICWELSQKLFELKNFTQIKIDPKALESQSVIIAITINGKKRGEIEIQSNAQEELVLSLSKENVAKWLDGKEIIKHIVVPNKIVNFVIKG